MGFVGGEVVPEVFEIDALAASLNQRFGSGTVETEVPNGRIVVNVFPAGYAREERRP